MRWIVVVLAASLVGLLSYGLASRGVDTTIDAALSRGERPTAPVRELPVLGRDDKRSLAAYRGQVVLLNVWASWCPPCQAEAPALERAHQRMRRHGGTVVGISARNGTAAGLTYVRDYGLTFPNLRDGAGDYAELFGADLYPETFLIDRRGRIVALLRGELTDRWVSQHVLPLLRA